MQQSVGRWDQPGVRRRFGGQADHGAGPKTRALACHRRRVGCAARNARSSAIARSILSALVRRNKNPPTARAIPEAVVDEHLQLATLSAISIRSLITVSTGIKKTAISRIRCAIRANILLIRRLHSFPRQLTSDTNSVEPTTEKSPPEPIGPEVPSKRNAKSPKRLGRAAVAGSWPADARKNVRQPTLGRGVSTKIPELFGRSV
jgi:hypothetical protein